MKVLFINPPYARIYSKVITAAGINPPVGLACIASYLRENGVEVSILDTNALQIPFQNFKKHTPKDFDIVGVSSYTPSVDLSIKTLELAREINPNCKTIMGGSHITGDSSN
jgi:anaerobic magnesium-protoporphyrin IX monomethyl ester cyclase